MSCTCGNGGKIRDPVVGVQVRAQKTKVFVQTGGKRCKRHSSSEGCCSGSRLRGEGIKKTNIRGIYFADADLVCSPPCFGFDDKTVYEWTLLPTDKANPGNLRIVGSSHKVGDDRVEVAGTGMFDLSVKVTFQCRHIVKRHIEFVECIRTAAVRFAQ